MRWLLSYFILLRIVVAGVNYQGDVVIYSAVNNSITTNYTTYLKQKNPKTTYGKQMVDERIENLEDIIKSMGGKKENDGNNTYIRSYIEKLYVNEISHAKQLMSSNETLVVAFKRKYEIERQDEFCCEALTAPCLACHLNKTVKDFCKDNLDITSIGCKSESCLMDMKECNGKFLTRNKTDGCKFPACPVEENLQCANCTKLFDGCNQCKCDADGNKKCNLKVCQKDRAPMCLDNGGQNTSEEYNCWSKEVWTNKKRTWCCINKRLGCCPVVRCAEHRSECTRTKVRDINKFGCLVYPCGKDVCSDTTEKKPQITVKDSRNITRLSVPAVDDRNTSKVTIQIMDKRGRTRVSLGAQNISMKNTENIIRRRNIVRAIVEIEDGVVMDIEKAGVKMNYKTYLKKHNIIDIMFMKARNKTRDTNDCKEADINLVRGDDNTMAYEIVLTNTGDNAFNCYNGIPLSLLTLETNNADGKNEYSVKCWSDSQWVSKGTLKESEEYTCARLPGYRHIIGSLGGTVTVNSAQAAVKSGDNDDAGLDDDAGLGLFAILMTIGGVCCFLHVGALSGRKSRTNQNLQQRTNISSASYKDDADELNEKLLNKPIKWIP